MHIKDKVLMDLTGLEQEGPINIVAFGDSVTHGALRDSNNYETVYWNLLKQKINAFRDYVPVNVINAGIGGTTAKASLKRMDRQVFAHMPDLVIVCFGLNDINGPLEDYLSALETIFIRCKEKDIDTIFLTPNMLNTYVAEDTPKQYLGYAAVTAEYQNSGKMDLYMNSAIQLAQKLGVPVCDCYTKWKELSKTTDTTMLLINRINHPVQEMHQLFADELYKLIIDDANASCDEESSMYRSN